MTMIKSEMGWKAGAMVQVVFEVVCRGDNKGRQAEEAQTESCV